jgi:leader peptidase (prepilin peptidase)/N-methyltransferase
MWPAIFGCLVPSALIAWTDYKSHRVPNIVTLPMIAAGLAWAAYAGYIFDSLAGAGALFAVGLICFLIGGMGGGDVKFMAALGAWFGLHTGLVVVLVACIIGTVWGLGKKAKAGRLRKWAGDFFRSLYLRLVLNVKGVIEVPRLPEDPNAPVPREALPFGTCLAAAAWLVFFGGDRLGL